MAYEKLTGQITSKPESNATPTSSSANRAICSSKGASNEASVKNVAEAKDVPLDLPDSGVFQNSNGSELADQIGGIHLNESSSSSLTTPKGSAVKHKRLAANFSKLHQKESQYTVNERFLEEFEDIELLGSGGYGNVFKAKHKIDNKIYAVKRVKLTDGKAEKTKREVQALAELVHENIVQYFCCWIGKDRFSSEDSMSDSSSRQADLSNCLFIRMDYCEKGTLENWIAEEKRKGKESYHENVLMKFQQIVKGVAFIHEQKFIHRDLKPLNIFISRDDKIKIGDFGLVASDTGESLEQRTQNKGTILYMAPEQVGRSYGKEVDIFSLGLILLEMLSSFETQHERIKDQCPVVSINPVIQHQVKACQLMSVQPGLGDYSEVSLHFLHFSALSMPLPPTPSLALQSGRVRGNHLQHLDLIAKSHLIVPGVSMGLALACTSSMSFPLVPLLVIPLPPHALHPLLLSSVPRMKQYCQASGGKRD
ncbi:hypothetical protein JD844_024974 [Phrynosoma platyrhinos]|uniref:Protein kinase domain-containing protein n=1 Tax=Phrynosoma platyrhinos TaxID=52577 RepID=A0ABQ7SYT8_PHRPL|nr:hypothetical protein JD844_024974 [Phrynosoma platyrhinos]